MRNCYLLASPFALELFAADRIDTWVLRFGVVIVLVCIAGVGLWQLLAYLARRRPKQRIARLSPEPPSANQPPKLLPRVRTDDPDKLQQDCSALEDSLAEMYLELAERWFRRGQPQKATAALQRIVQLFPERREAQLAQERLRAIEPGAENH